MKLLFRGHSAALLLLMSFAPPIALVAQENGVIPTSKILFLSREYTKPGKDGTPHQMTEAAYLRAEAASKNAPHYFAVSALTGQSRTLFLYAYPSFAAMESEHKGIMSDASLSAALDRASVADGDLLSETDASLWMTREDLSLNPGFRVGAHYMEISQYLVRPGHGQEWEQLVKLVVDGYKKGVPDAHWGTYEQTYGSHGGAFLVISTMKSASDIDADFASGKQFEAAMGEDGIKKLEQLEAACVESSQHNLFVIDPKMSNPSEVMMKADPSFWKSK